MNHHLHESVEKKSGKLATLFYFLFKGKCGFLFISFLEYLNRKQTMIPA